MKLEFSFKDVPKSDLKKNRTIDLSKNTVIFGNNGRGKTRILTTIDGIHKIANLDFESKLLNLIDETNLDNLRIDDVDYTKLMSSRNVLDDNDFLKFLQRIRIALGDYYSSMYSLSNLSYMFKEVLNRYLRALNDFLKYIDTSKSRRPLNFNRFEYLIKDTHMLLRRIRNEFTHSQTFSVNQDGIDILHELQNALSINEYLVRTTEDYRYKQLDSEVTKIRDIKSKMKRTLNSTDSHYISPSTDFDSVIKTIEDEIISSIDSYSRKFFEEDSEVNQEIKKAEKVISDIKDKLSRINDLLISGYGGLKIDIKNKSISFTKKQEEKFITIEKNKLSSGEKRVLKLFLTVSFIEANLFLIDEPEVSLSLNFQSKIVNDLLNLSNRNNKKLILATHAPYIFDDCINNNFERLEL